MAQIADLTGETLYKASDLSRQQADIQALRLDGLTHQGISDVLGMELGSVKSQCSRIDNKKTVRLPRISKIETPTRVNRKECPAVVIWFANGAKLRYVAQDETVYEETFHADDPDSVYESFDIAAGPNELEQVALESIAEYINTYRDDLEAARTDWPHVFEALLLIKA